MAQKSHAKADFSTDLTIGTGGTSQPSDLHRGLTERHMSLLALGSCIGVGLFLGSAKAIQLAGPAILFAYAVGGMAMFVIIRALGEMTLARPIPGSFTGHAHAHLTKNKKHFFVGVIPGPLTACITETIKFTLASEK